MKSLLFCRRVPLAVLRWGWMIIAASGWAHAASEEALHLLSQPGHVLLLRHANAPGVGDPSGFVLDDCTTQRNLDHRGRAQATALGHRLRAAGLGNVNVYTSQWCRCRETATLLKLGNVQVLPALNSFFDQPEMKAGRLQALRVFIDKLPREAPTVILVTHQLTIAALTGDHPASGEGMILRLKPGGGFEPVGTIANN
jgi:broad specificity phosphatase PhoE